MDLSAITSETRALFNKAFASGPLADDSGLMNHWRGMPSTMKKAYTQPGGATTGLQGYYLERPAKNLIPVITPLRNMIPRETGGFSIQANWRAVTALNTGNVTFGVSEGNRSPVVSTTEQDFFAAFKSYGLEDYVTSEAFYAAREFEDILATASMRLLWATMIQEENMILGGNSSIALGTVGTITATPKTSGGSLSDATYSVICVALTYEGFIKTGGVGPLSVQVSRTTADGTVEPDYPGTSIKSAAAAPVVSGGGGNGSVACTVVPITGAVAYAWFFGSSGSETLNQITTVANSLITAASAGGAQAAAGQFTADYSKNLYTFNGIMSLIQTSGSGSYLNVMPNGSTLTADGVGGVVELDAALESFWDKYRLSPDAIWCNGQEMKNITKKVLTGSTSAAQRFNITIGEQGAIKGGDLVTSYLNKFTMAGAKEIPLKLHPNIPPGTIIFTTKTLPYPMSNVPVPLRMAMRHDYLAILWPPRKRQHEMGVYADGVLQAYYPPSMGMITNITNG